MFSISHSSRAFLHAQKALLLDRSSLLRISNAREVSQGKRETTSGTKGAILGK
jgi:hypothetical protein